MHSKRLAFPAFFSAALVLTFSPDLAWTQGASEPQGLDEIVVTANKREERLLEVAEAVSVVTGDDLQDMGAQSLADYITKLPGVHFNDYQPGVSEVVIRGVSSTTYHEQGQTVVGYYINEIPLSEAGWPVVIPDIDTFDLERVEVLRGPQGTLFGASALGGLVNYVVKEADPSALAAAAETSLGSTSNAEEVNYALKGMINVPLIDDRLAVRAVALQRFEAGYYDSLVIDEEGLADLTTRGGRISAVFNATDRTTLSWLTLYQETELEDQTYVYLSDATRYTTIKEPHDTDMLVNSLRLDHDFDFGTLTVLGAAAEKNARLVFDSFDVGYLQGMVPTHAVSNVGSDATHFEARLASAAEGRFDWLVGVAAYESEKDTFDISYQEGAADYIDANPALFGGHPGSLLAPGDVFTRYIVDQSNEDVGIFGEVSFDLTDTLELTAGGRWFDTQSDTTVARPPSATFPGSFDPVGTVYNELQEETGFTPKVSLAYRPTGDLTIYALYSEGFRVGGANPNPPNLTGVPTSYDSDGVKNYEIGMKTSLMDGDVYFDATVFRIDWEDIQTRLFTPAPFFYSFVTNAGAAKIEGLEFASAWRVTPSFELHANVTYQDARLSQFLPNSFAPGGGYAAGTVLPGSSKWSTSETATWYADNLPWSPRIALSHRYLADAPVAFGQTRTRGEFNLWDLRVEAMIIEGLTASLFVNNLFDEVGILNAPFTSAGRPVGTLTRPRTIGLRVNWEL